MWRHIGCKHVKRQLKAEAIVFQAKSNQRSSTEWRVVDPRAVVRPPTYKMTEVTDEWIASLIESISQANKTYFPRHCQGIVDPGV
jgi:hypothetical protein